mgnify:CR=1 FL=1
MFYTFANLSEKEWEELKSLEKDIGHPILVFDSYNLTAASITNDELQKIQEFEKKYNKILIVESLPQAKKSA